MESLKAALTYEQQIENLQSKHSLSIPEYNEALTILKRINYYRLSGYGIGMTKPDDTEQYREGVSIDTLYRLYSFDSSFRNAMIHVVEQIEIQLRTQIANYLSLKYGPECYTDASLFIAKTTKD